MERVPPGSLRLVTRRPWLYSVSRTELIGAQQRLVAHWRAQATRWRDALRRRRHAARTALDAAVAARDTARATIERLEAAVATTRAKGIADAYTEFLSAYRRLRLVFPDGFDRLVQKCIGSGSVDPLRAAGRSPTPMRRQGTDQILPDADALSVPRGHAWGPSMPAVRGLATCYGAAHSGIPSTSSMWRVRASRAASWCGCRGNAGRVRGAPESGHRPRRADPRRRRWPAPDR